MIEFKGCCIISHVNVILIYIHGQVLKTDSDALINVNILTFLYRTAETFQASRTPPAVH